MLDFGNNPYEPGEALLGQEIFEEIAKGGLSGTHRQNGVLIVKGKGIKKGGYIRQARICDLAPTILYTMGEKIPSDMDGQVLLKLFKESFIRNHVVEYDESDFVNSKTKEERMKYTDEETEEIQKRLRALGYL
jgi:arylsulfatase A-like enzyme